MKSARTVLKQVLSCRADGRASLSTSLFRPFWATKGASTYAHCVMVQKPTGVSSGHHNQMFAALLASSVAVYLSAEEKYSVSVLCDKAPENTGDVTDDDGPQWGRGDKTLKQILDEHYEGKDNWPWVWCHRNQNGPLYVFSGVDKDTLWKCQQVAAANPNHNLLLIATQEQIAQVGATVEDFFKCRCGIHPGPIAELDLCNKIFMLEDERVVEFDHLQIV